MSKALPATDLHSQIVKAFHNYYTAVLDCEQKRTRKSERALTAALRDLHDLIKLRRQEVKNLEKPKGKPRANNIKKFNDEHKGELRGITLIRHQEKQSRSGGSESQ